CQRVTEVGRKADVRGGVVRGVLPYILQTGPEEVDGSSRVTECRIAAPQCFVDVRPARRRQRLCCRLEPLDRLGIPAAARRSQAERDTRPYRTLRVTRRERFVEDALERLLCSLDVLAKT